MVTNVKLYDEEEVAKEKIESKDGGKSERSKKMLMEGKGSELARMSVK